MVSRQYLNVCKSHNVIGINKTKLNQELEVNPKYAEKSYQTVFEIGVKLGHVLWRKLQPDVRLIADKHLINCCYDLIESEQYELATAMLKFATEEIKQHADEEVKKILIINKALNYYLQGKSQTCKKELGDTDWSATNDKFKLAVSVLNEQYNDSVLYMKNIGPNHKDIGKNEYQTWPLFKKFRTTADFQKTYKDIFNEDFKIIEKQPKEFVRLIKSLEGKEKQQQPTKHKAKRVSRKKKQ